MDTLLAHLVRKSYEQCSINCIALVMQVRLALALVSGQDEMSDD
jgi:hypothetical protein